LPITELFIDQQVARTPEAEMVAGKAAAVIRAQLGIPALTVRDAGRVFDAVASADDPVRKGKEVLFLTRNRGPFIRKCPGTRAYTCCGYQILHIGTFCIMECSYCILQAYFHPPVLQHFVNYEDMLTELRGLFAQKTVSRIGTGEFTDSLIWERWTGVSKLLVGEFAAQSRAVLELKTKTAAVGALKGLSHNRKTVMAWSLNTGRVILSEERGTASLPARLRAAAKCESWGYPLAFHFDPMIIYQGCEADYIRVAESIFSHVSPENIVWISLGTFRFMPALKTLIQGRFPDSKIIYGEFVPGLDGKMRYFKPLRIDLYRALASRIREIAPRVPVYLCMEDEEVWEKSLGFAPTEPGGLSEMLDESAMRHCGIANSD